MQSKWMKVLHCMGLPMVVMIEKITRKGTICCNIMARRSFGDEQLQKKSMKSSSPCQKAQGKVCHLIIIQVRKIFDIAFCKQFQPLSPQRQLKKRINDKEKSKLRKVVKILVSSDIQEEDTIDNESPIVTKADIQEFKAKTIMYGNQHMEEITMCKKLARSCFQVTLFNEC